MINVVCFKWGNKFGPEYVNKLYSSILRNTNIPIQFTCFTEDPVGLKCATRPFLVDLPYWWYIIGLFNQAHGFEDRVIYFDLDTVIVKNIDNILSIDRPFIALRDYYRPNGLQTAYISWVPEYGHFIWEKLEREFGKNYQKLLNYSGGTNRFLELAVGIGENVPRLQDIVYNQCHSYKVHIKCNNDKLLDSSKVIFFHGKPMPHEMHHLDWMKEHWVE